MILIIDNYDSFTFNLAHALGELGREITVKRNDAVTPTDIDVMGPEAIVISPGPGRPADSGVSREVIERFAGKIPILGVCLGHQCIAEVFGGRVVRAREPVHGKTSDVFHDGRTMYRGVRNPFKATRYHSLMAPEDDLPSSLEVSAWTLDGVVMGIRAKGLAVEGVQFHPESIATPLGKSILRNFLEQYVAGRQAA